MKMTNEQHLKHLDALKTSEERSNFESLWQAGADFCNPDNSDIQTVSAKGQRRKVTRVTDVGIEARRRFATGMYSYAIGSGRFFSFRTEDSKLMDNEMVARWFNEVDRITHTELKRSNFDAEILQSFGELSYIGTTSTFSEWYEGRLNFKTQHISQFWIDVDARGVVNKVFVEFPLTAQQIVDEFGDDKLPDEVKRALAQHTREEFHVVQVCFRNPDFVPDSIMPKEREYISKYILRKGAVELRIDGYDEFPFATGRLYKAKNEMYGRSCYMEAAQTISLHNDERATLIRGAKNRADPPWIEAADSRTRHIRTNGISRVVYDASALGGPPVQMDIKSDVGITEAMLEMDKEFIFRAFYIPAFNPLLDQKNMTAFETSQRIDIGLSEITPPLAKWQSEYASPLLERVYGILNRKGKYPDMPEMLEGKPFKIEYISKASLALRQIELFGVMSTYERSAMIAQYRPDVMDNFDVDEMVKLSAEVDNVPNAVLLPSEDVADIREMRAQQAQQQQMIENIPAIADGAFKASQIEGE